MLMALFILDFDSIHIFTTPHSRNPNVHKRCVCPGFGRPRNWGGLPIAPCEKAREESQAFSSRPRLDGPEPPGAAGLVRIQQLLAQPLPHRGLRPVPRNPQGRPLGPPKMGDFLLVCFPSKQPRHLSPPPVFVTSARRSSR